MKAAWPVGLETFLGIAERMGGYSTALQGSDNQDIDALSVAAVLAQVVN